MLWLDILLEEYHTHMHRAPLFSGRQGNLWRTSMHTQIDRPTWTCWRSYTEELKGQTDTTLVQFGRLYTLAALVICDSTGVANWHHVLWVTSRDAPVAIDSRVVTSSQPSTVSATFWNRGKRVPSTVFLFDHLWLSFFEEELGNGRRGAFCCT